MKKILFACFAILQFIACTPTPPTDATEKTADTAPPSTLPAAEQKALQLTATALTGEATGSITPDGRALNITISNSVVLDQEPDLLPLHSSRAAWVFYKNAGNDRPSYEKIVVHSQVQDTTITREYTTQELAIVKARLPTFEQVGKLLVASDYPALYALFDPSVMKVMKLEGFTEYFTQLEPKYGRPIAYELRGFAFNRTSGGKDFLSLAGPLKRQLKDTALDVAIDLSKSEMKGSVSAIKFDY